MDNAALEAACHDCFSSLDGVPPLLTGTLQMDQAVGPLLKHIAQPFADPAKSSEVDYRDLWFEAEEASRSDCYAGVETWLQNREVFPILDDTPTFFLARRFDQASHFLQSMFDQHQETPLAATCDLEEMLRWSLTTWWDNGGLHRAFEEDEESYLDRVFPRAY